MVTVADYFVAVSVTRMSIDGYVDTSTKSVRVAAPDPITAGEDVLDRFISGSKWLYTSALARVSSFETGEPLATVRATPPKPSTIPRQTTEDLWEVHETEPAGPHRPQ